MEKLRGMLKNKFELPIGGGSAVGILLKAYEIHHDPIILKTRDKEGNYTNSYKISDLLTKGYAFSKIHKELDGHNVAYIGDNHVDIISLELGCWMNRKYTTGFFKNDSIEDIVFKIKDADIDIIAVDSNGWDTLKSLPSDIKAILKTVFCVGDLKKPDEAHGFKELRNLELKSDISNMKHINYDDSEENLNSVIKVVYTSGSTGKPKGVPLTNKNCLYACFGFINSMFNETDNQETTAFFLPNAHIFQTACLGLAYTGAFVGHITTKETFKEDLPKIKPTFVFGVPLLFQKLSQQVEIKLTSMLGGFFKESDLVSPTWKNKLFIKPIFSKLVRKKLGFDKVKVIFSAGAALNSKVYDFFDHTLGIKISGAYGMSETTATLSMARIGKKGASGKVTAVNTVEIRNKNEKEEGEIWAKGENIFKGYLNHDSKDDFDDRGFFKTGDLGLIDKEDFLTVTGRIKNFHKASDGRFYNIEAIADHILDKSFKIQQVAIHLLDSPYPMALVTLGEEFLDFDNYINDSNHLEEIKKECLFILKELEEERFHPVPKKFILTPSYTEDNGFLTPTKKTKVSKVLKAYEEAIKSMRNEKSMSFCYCSNYEKIKEF
ncbi:MAG: hypothetical protein CME68_03115 [Halobacteriovoraceae bacterium]|nr:hypothetical protein [Halobacteriovoraceae bacterium]